MEALKTYTQEKTLAERVNEILAAEKMNKQELAMKLNISRSMISQYLNGKYNSNPETIEARLKEFVSAYENGTADIMAVPDTMINSNVQPAKLGVTGGVKPKIQYFESTDYVQTIGTVHFVPEGSRHRNSGCPVRIRQNPRT